MKESARKKAMGEAAKLSLLMASGIRIEKCPFCGSDKAEPRVAITEDGKYCTYTVLCPNCNTGIFRARSNDDEWNAYKDAEDAIDAWNRRKDQ